MKRDDDSDIDAENKLAIELIEGLLADLKANPKALRSWSISRTPLANVKPGKIRVQTLKVTTRID